MCYSYFLWNSNVTLVAKIGIKKKRKHMLNIWPLYQKMMLQSVDKLFKFWKNLHYRYLFCRDSVISLRKFPYNHAFLCVIWQTDDRFRSIRYPKINLWWRWENTVWKEMARNPRIHNIWEQTTCGNSLRKHVREIDLFEGFETRMTDLLKSSKSAKLWLDCFIRPVLFIIVFTRADREFNWPLHFCAPSQVLPCFFASGHVNYARCGI